MTDEPDLLPCPFCGESAAYFVETTDHYGDTYFHVCCDDCEAESFGCFCVDKISAAIEWNTRTPPKKHNDQRFAVCTKSRCQPWWGMTESTAARTQPQLIKCDKYWYCPKCGASYGENPHPDLQASQRAGEKT